MKEHGMLFKPEMVLATMREIDPKTQTRRVVTFHNSITEPHIWKKEWHKLRWNEARLMSITFPVPDNGVFGQLVLPCWHVPFEEIVVKVYPRVQPGHVIWGRETYLATDCAAEQYICKPTEIFTSNAHVYYKAGIGLWGGLEMHPDYPHANGYKWIPSIHMPRWAARLIFDVSGVRSQRVQEISAMDAIKEGIKRSSAPTVAARVICEINAFQALWDSINLERGFGWDDNHPVWIYDFKRKEG